jgi:hypothetical protein
MASIPIRINEELYNDAKKVALAEFRSIGKQIEYWARIGKLCEENPQLPLDCLLMTELLD